MSSIEVSDTTKQILSNSLAEACDSLNKRTLLESKRTRSLRVLKILEIISSDTEALQYGITYFIMDQTHSNCYWGRSLLHDILYYIENDKLRIEALYTLIYMLYSIDCTLLFRNESGIYILSSIFRTSTDADVIHLIETIIKHILEVSAEDISRYLSVNEQLLLCMYDDPYIVSTALYWLSVHSDDASFPRLEFYLLHPNTIYTKVAINYFNQDHLQDATLCLSKYNSQICIFDQTDDFYSKISLLKCDMKIFDASSKTVTIYVPKYMNGLEITFINDEDYSLWTTYLLEILAEKDSTKPCLEAPTSKLVNLSIADLQGTEDMTNFQCIQFLLNSQTILPQDYVSILRYLCSLLYTDDFVPFIYTYAIPVYIMRIMNLSIDEIINICEKNKQYNIHPEQTPEKVYEQINKFAIYFFYQLSCHTDHIGSMYDYNPLMPLLFSKLNDNMEETSLLCILNILSNEIQNGNIDMCIKLLKHLKDVMDLDITHVSKHYITVYHRLLLEILSGYLDAGDRTAVEITKNDGFNFIYNIYVNSGEYSIKNDALELLDDIYGYVPISYNYLSIQYICMLCQLKKERILLQALRYMSRIASEFISQHHNHRDIKESKEMNQFIYITNHISLIKDILLDILRTQYQDVMGINTNQTLIVYICILLQSISLYPPTSSLLWDNRYFFFFYNLCYINIVNLLISAFSRDSGYSFDPDTEQMYILIITVTCMVEHYPGDLTDFWSRAPDNMDISIYETIMKSDLPPKHLGALCLFLASLNKSPFLKEIFVKHQHYTCIENVFLTMKELAVEGAAVLLGTIGTEKEVCRWICELEDRGRSHIFTKVITNYSLFNWRTITSLLYCLQNLVTNPGIKIFVFDAKNNILHSLVNFSNGENLLADNDTSPSLLLLSRIQNHNSGNSMKMIPPIVTLRAALTLERLVENPTGEQSILTPLKVHEQLFNLLKCNSSEMVAGLVLKTLSNRIYLGSAPMRNYIFTPYIHIKAEIKSKKFGGGFIKCVIAVEDDRLLLYKLSSPIAYKVFYLSGKQSCHVTQDQDMVYIEGGDYIMSLRIKEDDIKQQFLAVLNKIIEGSLPTEPTYSRDFIEMPADFSDTENTLTIKNYYKPDYVKVYNCLPSLSANIFTEDYFNLISHHINSGDILLSLQSTRCIAYLLLSGLLSISESTYITILNSITSLLSNPLRPSSISSPIYSNNFSLCHYTQWVCPACLAINSILYTTCSECNYILNDYNEHLSTSNITWSFPYMRNSLYGYISACLCAMTSSDLICNDINHSHIDILFKTLYGASKKYIYYALRAIQNITKHEHSKLALVHYLNTTNEPFAAIKTLFTARLKGVAQYYIYNALFKLFISLHSISISFTQQFSKDGLFEFLSELYLYGDTQLQQMSRNTIISLYSRDYQSMIKVPIHMLLNVSLWDITEIKESALLCIYHMTEERKDEAFIYMLINTFIPILLDQLTYYKTNYEQFKLNNITRLILSVKIMNKTISSPVAVENPYVVQLMNLCLLLFSSTLYHAPLRVYLLNTITCLLQKNPEYIQSLGALYHYTGLTYAVATARELVDSFDPGANDYMMYRLYFGNFCIVIGSSPAGINTLFKSNIIHEVIQELYSKDDSLIRVSLLIYARLFESPGLGFNTVTGAYMSNIFFSLCIDIYKHYKEKPEIMSPFYMILRGYAHTGQKALQIINLFDTAHLLEDLVLRCNPSRQTNGGIEEEEKDVSVNFLLSLVLYRPFMDDMNMDWYLSNTSLYAFCQSFIKEVKEWALGVISQRFILGFCPPLSLFEDTIPLDYRDNVSFRDREKGIKKGIVVYSNMCLYLYRTTPLLKTNNIVTKLYIHNTRVLYNDEGGLKAITITNKQGMELMKIYGESTLEQLYDFICKDISLAHFPPIDISLIPAKTSSRAVSLKFKGVEIITPELIPYLRLSELDQEETHAFEHFISHLPASNSLIDYIWDPFTFTRPIPGKPILPGEL
ncbi:hypothetical protein WA158_008402 [Blastocystis sp. Blastoise]